MKEKSNKYIGTIINPNKVIFKVDAEYKNDISEISVMTFRK